eukprot:gene2983-3552_t
MLPVTWVALTLCPLAGGQLAPADFLASAAASADALTGMYDPSSGGWGSHEGQWQYANSIEALARFAALPGHGRYAAVLDNTFNRTDTMYGVNCYDDAL